MAPPDNEVLWARALVKSYDGSPALRGVSLGVREGEILAVAGPRGCGKSTLLDCLSGQLLPDEGEVWFHGVPVHTLPVAGRERLRRERFGWIGAEPRLIPELTACENAALPLLLIGASHRAARNAAQEWLERLDVADCARRHPGDLLQAQRQRVAIARALVARPTVVFADEPTAPLHQLDRGQVLRTLTAACRSHGMSIVLTTDDDTVAQCADRVLAMHDGRRVDQAAAQPPTAPGSGSGFESGAPEAAPARPVRPARPSNSRRAAPAAGRGRAGTTLPGGPGSFPDVPGATGSGSEPDPPGTGMTTNGTAVAVAGLGGAKQCSASA